MARDYLAVPATGAGVERMFNYARDICHYRRGSLKDSTVQDLMMYMCSCRFDSVEQEAQFTQESERFDQHLVIDASEGTEFELCMISDQDDENDDDEDSQDGQDGEEDQNDHEIIKVFDLRNNSDRSSESCIVLPPDIPDLPPIQRIGPGEKSLGKRRKSVLSISDDDPDLLGISYVRSSGRQRKAPKVFGE